MMKKIILLILMLLAFDFGFGQSIFENEINGTDPEDDNPYKIGQVFDSNIVVSGISRGSNINKANGADRYNANSWNTTSIDTDAFFEFTLTPNSTFEIDFVSFIYNGQVSGTGPSNFVFRSSLDNYVSNIGTPNATGITIDLSSGTYQDITSSVSFRIYGWGATTGVGTFSINDFVFNGVVFSSPCLTTTTWDGFAWDNGAPSLTTNAIIDGSYNTFNEGSFSACSLTVNTSGVIMSEYTLTVSDGYFIRVQNDILVNGKIVVQPQGAVVQINNDATVIENGSISVTKKTAPMDAWYEYTYWSSPVSGANILNGLTEAQADRRFVFYGQNFLDTTQESNNDGTALPGQDDIDDNGDDWQSVGDATIMTPGVGYASTHDKSLFSASLGNQFDYTFDGPFNNGIITVPIYRNDSELGDNNWNLIGNPYPSAIDVDLFLAENTEIEETQTFPVRPIVGAIYLWSQDTPPSEIANGNEGQNFSDSDYAIINGVTQIAGGDGVVPTRKIPSGQAFMVSYSDAATPNSASGDIKEGSITFNNSMRTIGTTDNSQFFKGAISKKKSNLDKDNKLWVNLTSDNGVFNQTAVAYVNNATDSDDGSFYDAKKSAGVVTGAILYSNIEGSDTKFGIQGKALNSLNIDETISLGFKSNIGAATLFKLSIDHLEGDFLTGNTVYLKDKLFNKVHDLSASDYTFTTEVGEFNERFEIAFNASALSTDEVLLSTNKFSIVDLDNDRVQFNTNSNLSIKTIRVFDLLGRQLYDLKGYKNSETYTLSNLNNAVYIAKIELSNDMVITKKAIKK